MSIATDNVQKVVTPKAGSTELPFLCSANCIMVINICIKFQENITNSFQVIVDTNILQKSLFSKFKRPKLLKCFDQSYGSYALHPFL